MVRVRAGAHRILRLAVRGPGRSDPIDATAIARAPFREGLDTLPVGFLDEQAHEIRLLNDYRDQLVNERVRLVNRLRWHPVQIAPDSRPDQPRRPDQPADPRQGHAMPRAAAPQISAIQAALDKVALGLLDDHAHVCAMGAADEARDAKTEELMAAVGRLMRRG